MRRVTKRNSLDKIGKLVTSKLRKGGVQLTMGGEPTYVPNDPVGAEWSVTAVGPTKLNYAYSLADALIKNALPGAVSFFSPGKSYPGEVNPRWTVHLLWNRDGSPLVKTKTRVTDKPVELQVLKSKLLKDLKVKDHWIRAIDPLEPKRAIPVLPLDHDGKKWTSVSWRETFGKSLTLLATEGPAGLRLPLGSLPPEMSRRALSLESKPDGLHIFLPPLLQKPFIQLLDYLAKNLRAAGVGRFIFEGYIPPDEAGLWSKVSITADPGVLEINLPPCFAWKEYDWWLSTLEKNTAVAGLRSYKQFSPEETVGTGGGNHLLFGGPSLEENPLFKNPRWITSMLRYWQHHPSLAYLFTGHYVGPSSQAPRPDESSRELYDLEMAYQFLEKLEPGDNRYLISETLRHLHTDGGGNTHRSETSFDKFWNVSWEGGCRGLIEFRAIESMPKAEWMSAVALLWQALAAFLLEKHFTKPLVEHGARLHDHYFLPTLLWEDFAIILDDLKKGGFDFDPEIFQEIWRWRFPQMLSFGEAKAHLSVRKAHEGWPLLCETPLEGGSTSRFVDTSIERLEFMADKPFATTHRVFVQGRELKLEKFPNGDAGAGLRYRRTALHPSLHPGIKPHTPLFVTILGGNKSHTYKLEENRRIFEPVESDPHFSLKAQPCKKLRPGLLTCDLRLP
ncbi:MAG: transglutaminase family protein [Chthoniobacteraceae bacterium]